MTSEPGRALALERVAAARLVLVLGDTDTGKTSLIAERAGALAARGSPVGVIDADLGQSEIGPPAAVGLGRVTRPMASLGEAEPLALAWVGRTSPPGAEEALWAGARRLAARAVALGLRPILVDTGGLVRGEVGRRVALGMARAVAPDLVVCLQRDRECEGMLDALAAESDADLLSFPASPAARRRTAHERRLHRERALAAYFAGALERELGFGRLEVGGHGGAELDRAVPPGTLVGLLDRDGDTLGLGRIVSAEPARDRLVVETPVVAAAVARVLLASAGARAADREATRHEANREETDRHETGLEPSHHEVNA